MRAIKFILYDTKRKEWVHDAEHAVSLFGETILCGELLRRPDDTIIRLIELNNIIAMQFTGLHDKNGKEIYEGDILQYDMDANLSFPKIMFFENGRFVLKDNKTDRFRFDITKYLEYTVIGNIYENPELIK